MTTAGKTTAAEINSLLAARYPLPKYSLAFEVPDGTGMNKMRTIDAVAMGCWATVGVQMIGHEIKVSRSDWQREMQDFTKCYAWKQHCHAWYLVAPKGVAKLEELPPSWGLMEPAGKGLKIRKPCEINSTPQPVGFRMLAAIMRRLQTTAPVAIDHQIALRNAYQAGKQEMAATFKYQNERQARDYEELLKAVATFRRNSGVSIDTWSGDDVGREFNAFQQIIRKSIAIKGLAEHASVLKEYLDSLQPANRTEGPSE